MSRASVAAQMSTDVRGWAWFLWAIVTSLTLGGVAQGQPRRCSHECDLSIRLQNHGCCPEPSGTPRASAQCAAGEHRSSGHCCHAGEEWVAPRRQCACLDAAVCGTPTPVAVPVVGTPTVAVTIPVASVPSPSPVSAAGGEQLLVFDVADHEESFEVTVRSEGGGTVRCPEAVRFFHPCRLEGIPTGAARITVSGAANYSRDVTIPEGHSRVLVATGSHTGRTLTLTLGLGGIAIAVTGLALNLYGSANKVTESNGIMHGNLYFMYTGIGMGITGGLMFVGGIIAAFRWSSESTSNAHLLDPHTGVAPTAALRPRFGGFVLAPVPGGGVFGGATITF